MATPKNIPAQENNLNEWDGHSRKGQAIYDIVFEQEQKEMDEVDPSDRYGIFDEPFED